MASPVDKAINVSDTFLTERALAARWKISVRSLQRARARATGPTWLRIGGCVRYRLEDVCAYELSRRQSPEATA